MFDSDDQAVIATPKGAYIAKLTAGQIEAIPELADKRVCVVLGTRDLRIFGFHGHSGEVNGVEVYRKGCPKLLWKGPVLSRTFAEGEWNMFSGNVQVRGVYLYMLDQNSILFKINLNDIRRRYIGSNDVSDVAQEIIGTGIATFCVSSSKIKFVWTICISGILFKNTIKMNTINRGYGTFNAMACTKRYLVVGQYSNQQQITNPTQSKKSIMLKANTYSLLNRLGKKVHDIMISHASDEYPDIKDIRIAETRRACLLFCLSIYSCFDILAIHKFKLQIIKLKVSSHPDGGNYIVNHGIQILRIDKKYIFLMTNTSDSMNCYHRIKF